MLHGAVAAFVSGGVSVFTGVEVILSGMTGDILFLFSFGDSNFLRCCFVGFELHIHYGENPAPNSTNDFAIYSLDGFARSRLSAYGV